VFFCISFFPVCTIYCPTCLFQNNKLETPCLPEETPEELAQVISPEPQHRNRTNLVAVSDQGPPSLRSVVSLTASDATEHVTLLSITHGQENSSTLPQSEQNTNVTKSDQ
jgi:hypothetical protein